MRLDRYPDDEALVAATHLGNILRRAEVLAGGRYGLDTALALPRLEPLLPERSAVVLSSHRDDLDFAARFSAALLVGAIASAALLATQGMVAVSASRITHTNMAGRTRMQCMRLLAMVKRCK
jgi:hypothetical protein